LGNDAFLERAPQFVVSDSFEFQMFDKMPNVAIAQSLFTHLTLDDIGLCLRNLRQFVQCPATLYATFFEGGGSR